MDDVAIVGGGIMGLAAAWAIAKRGAAVTLVDPRPLLNDHNASNDVSKIFRLAYGADKEMTLLAKRALPLWRDLERESGASILHPTGLALFGAANGFADQSARTLLEMGEPVEVHERDVKEKFPAFSGVARVVVDKQGGWLDPTAALGAFELRAVAKGAKMRRGVGATRVEPGRVVLSSGEELRARKVIVAAGFHAPRLVPALRTRIRVTRQVELFFRAPEGAPAVPLFAALEEGFYGFPPREGLVKVADHRKGPAVMNVEQRPPATREEEATARAWLAKRIPTLAGAPLVSSRVCLYDNTPDDRFVLGEHAGLVLAAGFSGHGFKFAPAVGEILADLALRA